MRRRRQRRERPHGLVVTEGKVTEIQYLEQLRQVLPRTAATFTACGDGTDPLRVVKRAVKERTRRDYDWVVCLVDCDEHATLEEAFALARREGVEVLVSNPCFEVWLLWHQEDWRRPGSTARQLRDRLTSLKLMRDKNLLGKFPVGNHEAARKRAKAAGTVSANCRGPNPSTALPALLDLLQS